MEIINSNQMPTSANRRLEREIQELKQGENESAFKLNVSDGRITSDELQRMLSTARRSKAYQKNSEKFQFKLIEGKEGKQVLTFKEQGWFSKLLGIFHINRSQREAQRAAAAELIVGTLHRENLSTGIEESWQSSEAMTHDASTAFHKNIMSKSGVAPLKSAGRAGTGEAVAIPTMQDLMNGNLITRASGVEDHRQSYEVYDNQEDAQRNTQPIGSPQPLYDNSLYHNQHLSSGENPWEMRDRRQSFGNADLINPPTNADKRLQEKLLAMRRDSESHSMKSDNSLDNHLIALLLKSR